MNEQDLVNVKNIYLCELIEERNRHVSEYDDYGYETTTSTIILEDTLKTRQIDNILYKEYNNFLTDEMVLVNDNNDIFHPKEKEIKWVFDIISISDFLDKVSSKNNSRYTDYIYSKVVKDLNGDMIPREKIFENIDNIKYLESYANNLEKGKIRVR